MDILIVKLGALGDVINTLPLAIALKDRLGARIHWVVAPLSLPLLEGHAAVDRTIVFDKKRGFGAVAEVVHRIRSQKFDLVLDLQRIIKSGLFCSAARGSRKIGFDRRRCKEMTWLLPFERIPASDPQAHMVHQYLEFAEYLGFERPQAEWRINTGDAKPGGLPSEYVVLNIGATKPANRWSAENFAGLARMVAERHRVPCVLTGGREDASMAEHIESAAHGNVCNQVGRTSLPELIDVLHGAAAVVTCDTGPMHLAVALGKKVIALFGPSDHRRTGPYRGKVIRARLDCVPCHRRYCASPDCMKAIRPEDVLGVLSTELAGERDLRESPRIHGLD